MNYQKNYYDYLAHVKTLGREKGCGIYYEAHHILPRALGGGNSKENLVLLTAREHFLAHYLLTKFTEGRALHSMLAAFVHMTGNAQATSAKGYCNARLYSRQRAIFVALQSEFSKNRSANYKLANGSHWNSGPSGPNPLKATARGKHWYINTATGLPELLFEHETTTMHIRGRGPRTEAQKLAVSMSNKARKNTSRKGIKWDPQKRKNNTGIKHWYYNAEANLSILSVEHPKEPGYTRGRRIERVRS